jgi:hypothetical protein
METLGSLCDKLIIVKLKQCHSDDPFKQNSLLNQEKQLVDEINLFIQHPPDNPLFPSNKVYRGTVQELVIDLASIGTSFSKLVEINCDLWHAQEKVYDFVNIPPEEKDAVVESIATLDLQRNFCIEGIDKEFKKVVECIRK